MCTGIIEDTATLVSRIAEGSNVHFTFQNAVAQELRIDQSLAHDGICLTIIHIDLALNQYRVTAIQETLNRTNLSFWQEGHRANIERCLAANGRFDGHIVQGHVDTVGTVDEIHDLNGSNMIFISYPLGAGITVPKGSITINGVSLTVVDSFPNAFSVAIIPHTWDKTNLGQLLSGSKVNLEFDILGKYVQRMHQMQQEL
jgi:riboflavin synthase